jgi:protein-L-isoaspartate(D-aspartate) O-methyltransferase
VQLSLGLSALVVSAVLTGAFAVSQRTTDTPAEARRAMIDEQLRPRGIRDSRVLSAMGRVPRERFVPEHLASRAYDDGPLPIGAGQTISQPYIVAYMAEALAIAPEHKVLEIGTGSGYHAAVLGQLAREVHTIEIVSVLASRAKALLKELGYANIHVHEGDGYAGLPGHAPFDRILVTAAPDQVPQPLIDQLAAGGRMVIPVGQQGVTQWMTILEKTSKGVTQRQTIPVQFVPFTRRP